ncbi:MAG: hypothetical protein AAF492_25410 [Verrucomicrobiota bacterium]
MAEALQAGPGKSISVLFGKAGFGHLRSRKGDGYIFRASAGFTSLLNVPVPFFVQPVSALSITFFETISMSISLLMMTNRENRSGWGRKQERLLVTPGL